MNLLSGIEQIKQLPVDRQRRFERFSRTQYRYRVLPLFADVWAAGAAPRRRGAAGGKA